MALSVFDMFKIGIGPSSSHTMGPMSAANMFLSRLLDKDWPRPAHAKIHRLKADLYGSLAYTGVGHATDRAVIIGLCGFSPQNVDPDAMDGLVAQVSAQKMLRPAGHPPYHFDPAQDLRLLKGKRLPGHTNGMAFEAYDDNEILLLRAIYYSIGGGFVVTEEELSRTIHQSGGRIVPDVPYPFSQASALLQSAAQRNLTIAEIQRANEEAHCSRAELDTGLEAIWQTMSSCIERGLAQEGILPGGLKVRRRAKQMYEKLQSEWKTNQRNPLAANDWLSVYAMAVNEENAAGGRIVTAPTNGAAGVVPAVLHYYLKFYDGADKKGVFDFLLTAAAIGGIIKQNASISGAEVGCQGEVGSASAMAAAGLAAALGATPPQVENAAEIALEHHLGMTCDPVAGLVQVPCIERNALGAVKAVTAASLALRGDGSHFVPLDNCIETMRQTGLDMDERYKETSEAGLAVNVANC